MKWAYAGLSETAKKYGGPEAFIKTIEDVSRTAGRREMYPVIGAVALIATMAGAVIDRLVIREERKKASEEESRKEAEHELLMRTETLDEEVTPKTKVGTN